MAYSHDGQGLHRSTDPADGEDYVYGHLFLDAAPTVFACFDQPDLKAPYTVAVTAPAEWTVLGNGAATRRSPRAAPSSATTLPLATYFVTVCAGPWASVLAEHDGIPLGVHARRVARAAPARRRPSSMLETTRACFDYYHRLFGIRYPFGEYHQVFVPEFNAGAMENPGCVTFRDTMVFRGAATPDQVLARSQHDRPRDGAHVVRRPRDDALVGRPVAQRVVRRVHGLPHRRRGHRVHRRLGRVRRHPQAVGVCRGAGSQHPPGRRGRRLPTPCRRSATSTASRTPRARR